MLSYRHAYHAGNFADVLKHAVLTLLLQSLARKDTPFCYVETHAGAGRYDLRSPAAQKNREYQQGIARLWDRPDLPAELEGYVAAVRALNPAPAGAQPALRYYPGSPRLARCLLRPGDRMVLAELHPSDVQALRQEFAGDRQVVVEQRDGYALLKAVLPPRERRGLVLMDPAFERQGELGRLVAALRLGWERWATGVYALWYPILDRATVERFCQDLVATGIRKMLRVELAVRPDAGPLGLRGSGLVIVNPPWQLDGRLEALLPWLWQVLSPERQGGVRVQWLVPE